MDSVQSMVSSSSSTVPSAEQTSYFSFQTEMEMESSKARHWSELDYSTSDSEWSAETNSQYFALLQEDPRWGHFFRDFQALEVGDKISGGAQADIYEARIKRHGSFDFVVKVMHGDAPLERFRAQWPTGILSARCKGLYSNPVISIWGGTVLRDERLRGRFAFVMLRRWGDLRVLIDRRMKGERSTAGPFPIDKAIHLMLTIAEDMHRLHNDLNIVHRDLKASNVLVWGEFGSLTAPSNLVECIHSVVADFECSVGVLGTGFWRAPEILEQMKARVRESKVQFTRASDVYSYGMTCYEVVTGCIPFEGLKIEDATSQVLQGQRPELPHELPEFVRNIILGCWHSNPSERPTFSAICKAFKGGLKLVNVIIDNSSQSGASIVKIEQWRIPQALTLLEVIQELITLDLLVLKAFDPSSTEMITQYFEVTDCEGKKVVDDKSIANITKALCFPIKTKCINESLKTFFNENTIVQMHVIEVVGDDWSADLFLGVFSRLLVATNFQVHSVGCWTREGRLECVIYVEGARIDTLLWELQHQSKDFPLSLCSFKIIVHRVAAKEFSYLNGRLRNLKSIDLTLPRNLSNICIYMRRKFEEDLHSIKVGVIFEEQCKMVDVSRKLVYMGYKVVGACIDNSNAYEFLKGKAKKSQDFDLENLENLKHIIENLPNERGCLAGNWQLIISGRSKRVRYDLMGSLHMNGLFVTGGQVYRESGTIQSFPSRYLEFFVTEKPAVGAG